MKNFTSLNEIHESIKLGSISCQSLVNYYLNRIDEHKELNIYIEVFAEEALVRAKNIDEKIFAGTAGRLAGMVVAIKDNICFKGHNVSAASKILEGFESKYQNRFKFLEDYQNKKYAQNYEDLVSYAKKVDKEVGNGSQFSTVVPFESMDKLIGIIIKPDLKITTKKYGFFESIGEGYDEAYWKLSDYIYQFGYVFTKEGASQLGGFGTIGSIFPAKWNWKRFWEMTAFLSIILAFMNFLPIPALDGGHIMFVLYEMVSGKKPSDKFLEYAHGAGFILLISLFLYANGMDVIRAFS